MNVRTLMKQSSSVLFCDSEHFNKDIKGCKNIEDVKDWMHIKGNVYKCAEIANTAEYKLAGSDYKFSLTFIR